MVKDRFDGGTEYRYVYNVTYMDPSIYSIVDNLMSVCICSYNEAEADQ